MPCDTTKVLIAEYVPSHNKGELAILNGILETLKMLGKVEVYIFSIYPALDRARYPREVRIIDMKQNLCLKKLNIKSKVNIMWASFVAMLQHILFAILYATIRKRSLKIMNKPLWQAYCECDVILICHDEVDCVNGVFFQFSPVYISLLAKTLRKPIVIFANGTTRLTSQVWIWKFHSKRLWKILAKYVLKSADLITVRDEETLLLFKEISCNKLHIYFTADPAILLSPADNKKIKEIMLDEEIRRDNGPLVGVALSREVLSEAFKSKVNSALRYKKAIEEIARLLDRLINEMNFTVIFIPHSVEPHRDDRVVARDIYQLMRNRHKAKVINREYSPQELKGLIGQLDLLITSRVHAAINALSMLVPSFIFTRSWDRRAYNIIGKMLNQRKWIYEIENLNVNKIVALIAELLNSRKKIRKDLAIAVQYMKEKALFNGKLLKAILKTRSKFSKPNGIITNTKQFSRENT